jgi:iron complex outermembrane recepter protein
MRFSNAFWLEKRMKPAYCIYPLVLFAGISWMHLPAHAQDASQAVTSDSQTQTQTQTLERVEVTGENQEKYYQSTRASTATKTDTPLIDTPQSITVVPREVLEDQGARNVADALRNVSGVSREASYWGQEGSSFRIRGFALSDEYGYYKDGLRYNAKGTQVLSNVERVEVLKGPASVLYGRAEPGGIVNLVTRAPEKKAKQNIEVSAGRWDTYALAFGSTGPLNDSASVLYRLDASVEDAGSFRDLVFSRTVAVAPTVQWQVREGTQLKFSAEAVRDTRRTDYGIPSYQGLPAAVPISTYYGELFNLQESRQDRFALTLNHALSKNWKIIAQAAQYRLRYPLYNDVYAGFVDNDTAQVFPFWENFPDNYKNTFAQTDLVGKFSTGPFAHTLLAGFETGRQLQLQNGTVFGDYFPYDIFNPQRYGINAPQGTVFVSNYRLDTRSQALYVQDQIDLGESWKLLLGARHDRYKQDYFYEPLQPQDVSLTGGTVAITTRDRATSPRAGLVYKLTPDLAFYASASQSFSPAFPYSQALQNQRFKPEIGKLKELGMKWDAMQGKVSLTTALYDLRKQNVITADPNNPQFSIQNGEESSRGFEIDLAAQPLRGLNIVASYARMKARLTQSTDYPVGNTLPLAPKNSGSIWASYEWRTGALKGFSLGGGAYYQGARFTDLFNDVTLPAFTRIDLAIGYARNAWKLGANLKNATNKRIFESSNSSAVIFPSAPRDLQVTLNLNF